MTQKQRVYIYRAPDQGTNARLKQFNEDLNETERNTWLSFKRICKDFSENHKAANHMHVVQNLLTSYKAMGCIMSLEIHFLEFHFDFFPENLGEVSYSARLAHSREVASVESKMATMQHMIFCVYQRRT